MSNIHHPTEAEVVISTRTVSGVQILDVSKMWTLVSHYFGILKFIGIHWYFETLCLIIIQFIAELTNDSE